MDILAQLKNKIGGVPVWVVALVGTGLLAVFLTRKKSQEKATESAANQTNSNLGSASELANLFNVAGLMPYQGGDTYVNVTVPSNAPKPTPTPPMNGGNPPHQPVPIPKPVPKPVPVPTPAPAQPSAPKPFWDQNPFEYRVKPGDSWSAIAARFGMTVADLKNFNMGSGYGTADRPASTIATLKARGDTLYSNEEIDIPHKGAIYAGGGGA